jgi:hypothetical protein
MMSKVDAGRRKLLRPSCGLLSFASLRQLCLVSSADQAREGGRHINEPVAISTAGKDDTMVLSAMGVGLMDVMTFMLERLLWLGYIAFDFPLYLVIPE